MKKGIKIILIIFGVIILLVGIDIINIYINKKPLFAITDSDDSLDKSYYGLLYNTYNCWEYRTPQIKAKWTKFSCSNNTIVGKITDIKDNYIIIKGLSDNNYLKSNEDAHISLLNNPKINGTNNLIIGQYIKLIPKEIKETYPISITTNEILIINN